MVTRIQKWGNSQGLRVSKEMLQVAQIGVGDEVELAVSEGTIVITPIRRPRRRPSLKELVARIPKSYRASETDWGKPVGKEEW